MLYGKMFGSKIAWTIRKGAGDSRSGSDLPLPCHPPPS